MPMNQPSRGDVHVDRPLTAISIAFMQSSTAFVADRVFPSVPVAKQTDKYFTIPRGAFFRDEMRKRAPGTEAPSATYDISTDAYAADVWALAKDLADQIRANYDSPLQADREITEFLTLKGLLRKENQFVADYFGTGVWTLDQTGVAAAPGANQFLQWNDAASTPIEDIRRFKRTVQERTGFRPGTLTMGREVFDTLIDHPDIVGRIDRGQTPIGPAIATLEALAALFELDEVLVMDSVQNTATEGAADSFSFIGGKAALLTYRPPSPGLMTPSAGYTFAWTGLMGGDATGMRMKRLRDEKKESDRLEIQMAFDFKVVSADLGIFADAAIA